MSPKGDAMCMEGGTANEGIDLESRKGDFGRSCGELGAEARCPKVGAAYLLAVNQSASFLS